jgi:hypothetical protein
MLKKEPEVGAVSIKVYKLSFTIQGTRASWYDMFIYINLKWI